MAGTSHVRTPRRANDHAAVHIRRTSIVGPSVDVGFESRRQVSDGFLLNMAEVSSQLIGLFLVGVLFFAEAGFRRLDRTRNVVEPYFR